MSQYPSPDLSPKSHARPQPAENFPDHRQSPSYRLAYQDIEFLTSPGVRPLRMQLEFLKPELTFQREQIQSTVVVFGSTRIVEPAEAHGRLERRGPGWPRPRTSRCGSGPSAGRAAPGPQPLL